MFDELDQTDDLSFLEIDMLLADVYSSWMGLGVELDNDHDREALYMHLRLAFLAGQRNVLDKVGPALNEIISSWPTRD